MAIKFNQYWDLVCGRKVEYAEFVQEDFLPVMRELGIEIVAGWVVRVGEGPHIITEGIAADIRQIQAVLESPAFKAMTIRHMRYVRNYTSKVLVPSGRVKQDDLEPPAPGVVKFNQSWNIRPGFEAEYEEVLRGRFIPTLRDLGVEVVAEWNVLIGSGPYIILEAHAPDLETVAKALSDPTYNFAMAHWEDLVEDYRSRILVRHHLFLEAIREVYGTPIRSISEEDTSSMYGPQVD
jgi:hypothetical protein